MSEQVLELDAWTVVLLRRGERADEFSDEELEDLQRRHLDHLHELRRAGLILTSGPFADQPDGSLRGFGVYSCSPEQARSFAEADPSVRAGRLRVEAFVWMVPKGTMSFPSH